MVKVKEIKHAQKHETELAITSHGRSDVASYIRIYEAHRVISEASSKRKKDTEKELRAQQLEKKKEKDRQRSNNNNNRDRDRGCDRDRDRDSRDRRDDRDRNRDRDHRSRSPIRDRQSFNNFPGGFQQGKKCFKCHAPFHPGVSCEDDRKK